VATAEPTADVQALDRYVERLWRAELPIAASVDATTLRLVWLTAGFSVSADRAAVGDYLCAVPSEEIARRAHVPLPDARVALEALVNVGRLVPCPRGDGYCLDLNRYRARSRLAGRAHGD